MRKISTSNGKILAAFYFALLGSLAFQIEIPAFSAGQIYTTYSFSSPWEEYILGLFPPEYLHLRL